MQVVILCGGRGTRSYPFTQYYPKPMMPIGGTPILVHLMQLYAQQGVTDFVLAAGYRKEILDDYFQGRFSEWNVRIVDTGLDSNTGERIQQCEPLLDDTFFATYGDGLGNVDLDKLLAHHRTAGGIATVTAVPLRSQFGSISFDQETKVTKFHEKPIIQDHWVNAGFLVFNKEVFANWGGACLETDVLPALAKRGELYTYQHAGFWKSMDTSKDQEEFESLWQAGGAPWDTSSTRVESNSDTEASQEPDRNRS